MTKIGTTMTVTSEQHGHLICANDNCLHVITNFDRDMSLTGCAECGGEYVLVVRCNLCPGDVIDDMYFIPASELVKNV